MDGFDAYPGGITQLAADLRDVSNQLQEIADQNMPDWMCLGTSRTATRFADAMCALAGDNGAIGALRGWAADLSRMADSGDQTAGTYGSTESSNTELMKSQRPG